MNNAPFGNCSTSELHLADQIQSFGALIAIDKRTQLMCACSANIQLFVGKTPQELLGQKWSLLFMPAHVEGVFKHVEAPGNEVPQIMQAEFQHTPVLIASHSVAARAWMGALLAEGVSDREEPVDHAMNERIRREGSERSEWSTFLDQFVTVIGPRLTGSTAHRRAADWARHEVYLFDVILAAVEVPPGLGAPVHDIVQRLDIRHPTV